MHCDVDLRSRRMWAASYRLTRLVMNESSELLESFCTGHARVRAERGGDGGDGAVADAPVLGRRCCCSCTSSLNVGGTYGRIRAHDGALRGCGGVADRLRVFGCREDY